jgi:2-polyprenyl-3-methyl-5-hydroxy-6-metoxy-1,4-benzoquinol methylase
MLEEKMNVEGPDWYKPTRLFFLKKINRYVKGENILELGTKDGVILKQIKIKNKVGIDIDEAELKKAKAAGITVMKHELNKPIPLDSESFDNVICIEVLEHVFNFQNVLNEAYRILKPGGTFVVGVPYHGTVKNIAVSLTAFEHHYVDTLHVKFFTPKRLRRALKEAGFEIVEESRFGRVPLLWRVMLFVCRKPKI